MKILLSDAIYVQNNDIVNLSRFCSSFPASIYADLMNNKEYIYVDDSNRYEFIRFDRPEIIDFFKSQEWIIDYQEIKDLSETEIIDLAKDLAQKGEENEKQLHPSMTPEERLQNILQSRYLEYKIYTLRDFLWFKQGHIQMKFPEGVELSVGYIPEKGIKRFIKKFFLK